MKIEDEKILLLKKKNSKTIAKSKRKDFSKIVKKFQNKQKIKFSIDIIAAKIARGENVSVEELKYIRENSPALLSQVEKHNRERKEDGRYEGIKKIFMENNNNQ